MLELEVDYGDSALIQAFRRGLDPALRKKIDDMTDHPKTTDEWKEMALDKDEAMRVEREEEKAWASSLFHKPAIPLVPKKEAVVPVQPVVRVQAYTKLTEEDKTRLKATNGFFYCREIGHMVEDCPKRKKKQEGSDELLARLLALEAEEKAKLRESLKNF